MLFVFSRLAFGHDREIRFVQIDPTYQKDILLAVRKHGKYLGNLIFSSCFRVSIVPSRTGKGMEFEEVHHIFNPFGYGSQIQFLSVGRTLCRSQGNNIFLFHCWSNLILEMSPSAVRTAFDRKAVHKVELSLRRLPVLCNVPFVFSIIVKRL